LKKITDDQGIILKMLTEGFSDKTIARAVGIPTRTIENKVRVLKRRFKARSRTHLAVMVVKAGITE